MKYKISELIMDYEQLILIKEEDVQNFKTDDVRLVKYNGLVRLLTSVDDKNIKSIATPKGRELTIEELFNFIIGNNTTDLARTKNKEENKADIAIVLGNINRPETRERAIKAFELYKNGLVKKIIFTGGISEQRDEKGYMHPKTIEQFMSNKLPDDRRWQDLSEADWGTETFIPDIYDEQDYQRHSKLTEKALEEMGINPEDILFEDRSSSTQENAEFCRNIFAQEEIETGLKIRNAILVTTLWHGSRALKQFKKVFGKEFKISFAPSTLDLEKYETLKPILRAKEFDEEAFRAELKNIYCTNSELIQKLRTETANHRNVFIAGDIDDATITTIDKEQEVDPRLD